MYVFDIWIVEVCLLDTSVIDMGVPKRENFYMNCLPRICLSRCVLPAAGSIEGPRYINLGSAAKTSP